MLRYWKHISEAVADLYRDGPIPSETAKTDIEVGADLGARICESLDLDPNTVSRVEIDLKPGHLATVKLTYEITAVSGEPIGSYFKSYTLKERGPRVKG